MDDTAELKRALTLEPLLDAVRKEAGGLDFRDLAFTAGLQQQLAVFTRLPFTAQGLMMNHVNLVRCLVNRLRYQNDVAKHPEILKEDVSDPIVILGLTRSGTTKLQRIMSADPAVQPTYTWGMFNPAPFPGEKRGESHERVAWASAMATVVSTSNPEFNRIHEYDAVAADETVYFVLANFDHPIIWLGGPCKEYLAWARSVDRKSTLTYVKQMLQYLQWQQGGRRGPYIIKCPAHTGEIAEFLQVFPKATFIMSSRDLSAISASTAQMMHEVTRASFPNMNRHDYALELLDFWAYELHRFLRQRRELGDRVKIFDATYREILNDPIAVARAAYRQHGMTLTETGAEAMRAADRKNPPNKFGKFQYNLANSGLTDADVKKAFGDVFEEWRGL